jgi:peptidoglycan/LPS O-acetylase OafA/YrhL
MLNRRPALDGVRAFAIAAVVAYHFEPAHVPGGSLGVQVFFVLSGWLITTLLSAELEDNGRIDVRAFYTRRALRLVPALVVVVVLVVVAALALGPSKNLGWGVFGKHSLPQRPGPGAGEKQRLA